MPSTPVTMTETLVVLSVVVSMTTIAGMSTWRHHCESLGAVAPSLMLTAGCRRIEHELAIVMKICSLASRFVDCCLWQCHETVNTVYSPIVLCLIWTTVQM